jgi:hypothetical protein
MWEQTDIVIACFSELIVYGQKVVAVVPIMYIINKLIMRKKSVSPAGR